MPVHVAQPHQAVTVNGEPPFGNPAVVIDQNPLRLGTCGGMVCIVRACKVGASDFVLVVKS
jgi:hypothetical protein